MKILAPTDRSEGWAIVAARDGAGRMLTPEWIPFSGTHDEAIGRARIAFGRSAELRQRFADCWLFAVRVDTGFQVDSLQGVPPAWV